MPTGPKDDAIKTEVIVFKQFEDASGIIETGWVFPSGDAKAPTRQFCQYK